MNRPPPPGTPWHPQRPANPAAPPSSRPPEIPWYLQRPDRPPPPPVESQKSTATTDLKRFVPWLLLGVSGLALVVGAAVLISMVAHHGALGGTVLDVIKVQDGVLQTLSDPASGYGANAVTDVSCNGGRNPSAAKGTTFTCDATVNGAARHVTVVVSDDRGTYEIDSPR